MRRWIGLLLATMFATTAAAAPVTVPYTFEANKSLPASWLNGCFSALATGINNINTNQIIDGQIFANDLAAFAVTTTKINDAAVTAVKIADGNVTTSKLADGNVTTAKIGAAAVTTANLADQAVTLPKLAVGSTTPGVATTGVILNVAVTNDATETDIAVLPAFISRGGWITIGGAWGLQVSSLPAASAFYRLRLYRGPTVIQVIDVYFLASGGGDIPVPIPTWIDHPGAGSFVYKITAAIIPNPALAGNIRTPPANAGTIFAKEEA